jgi:hypothetical protein
MTDIAPTSDFSRQYGTNWTLTNVTTLNEWISYAAFNIRCLELTISRNRSILRNQMILGLICSTLSGTLSVSQLNGESSGTIVNYIFCALSFIIALSTGAMKIYKVQEHLEESIRLKLDWTMFATAIASELQLPIELRRDALFMIKKYKDTYLNLVQTEVEIPDFIRKKVAHEQSIQSPTHVDVLNISAVMMEICSSELNDMRSANIKNRDRFTRTAPVQQTIKQQSPSPDTITLQIAPPSASSATGSTTPPQAPPVLQVHADLPPARPPSYSAQSPSPPPPPQETARP